MPQFIPVAISAIGTAVGGSTLLYGTLAVASGIAIGSYQQRQARAKAKRDANAAQVDRLVNVVAATSPRELVLGRVRKGGHVSFRASTGTNKATFLMVMSIAAHEIDGIEQIYFNDVPVHIGGGGYVDTEPYRQVTRVTLSSRDAPPAEGTYVPGSLSATNSSTDDSGNATTTWMWQEDHDSYHARVWWDLGNGTAVADSRTQALFPDLWGSNHRGQGIAKLYVEFTYNENAFPSGLPVVSALVRGAKVYDPRSGLTAWSDNPALLARHVYQHSFFGKATVSPAEDARFIVAANACDSSQNWVVNGATTTADLYRAGVVAPYGTPARSLLDDLTQAMAGMWAFSGGELFIRAGVYTAPVLALSDSDLAVVQRSGESEQQDQLSIATHRERAQKFNVVNPRIWDAEQDYKQVALSPVKGGALITRDGAELAQEVTLSAVSFAPQAQHVCGVMMRDARDALTVEAPFKMTAWPVELFDAVSWTSSRYGWSAKTFVVLGRRWDRARGVVWLTLKETAAAIFTPDAAFLPNGYARNTSNPSPWDIRPPVLSAVYSGTGELVRLGDGSILTRVRVEWPALVDASITSGGFVEVEWSGVESLDWQRVTVGGDATEALLIGPADGQPIIIRARTRNAIAVSKWSVQVVHTVLGKTAPPSDVAWFSIRGQTLEWPAVNDVDLEGYEVRFNYGNSTAWGTATPLHIGVITASPWTPELVPPGQITLLIKAKDTTGNYSANAAAIVANLGDVIVDNLILSYDDKAAGFPGTKTSCAVSGGDLLADDSGDLFWGANGGNFWSTGSAAFWPTATYLSMDYEMEYVVNPTEAGSRLTLNAAVAAQSYTLEYRYDSQDLFWGDDAEFMWERSDTAAFWPPLEAWQAWPGELTNVPEGAIQFRITTQAGVVQGAISTLTLQFDVEDEFEELDNVAISAAGTRLPITKAFRTINNVQLTLQDDGGSAVSVQWVDKNATLGPLVQCINSAGALVAGVLDARIQGVKG